MDCLKLLKHELWIQICDLLEKHKGIQMKKADSSYKHAIFTVFVEKQDSKFGKTLTIDNGIDWQMLIMMGCGIEFATYLTNIGGSK